MRAISHVRIGRRRDGLQRIIWAGGPTGALRLNPAHHFRATAQLTRHDAARTKFMKNISKAGKGASLLPPGHPSHRPLSATLSSSELKRIVAAVLG